MDVRVREEFPVARTPLGNDTEAPLEAVEDPTLEGVLGHDGEAGGNDDREPSDVKDLDLKNCDIS